MTGRPICARPRPPAAARRKSAPRVPKLPPTSRMTSRTLVVGNVEHGGELAVQPPRRAAAGVDRVSPARGIVLADRGARLHRRAGDARHPGLDLRDVRGARERRSVASPSPTCASMQTFEPWSSCSSGAPGFRGVAARRSRRQRLVVDRDALGAVLRRGNRLRHHHGDRLADEARLVDAAAESPAR